MTNKQSEFDVKKSLQDAGYIVLGIGVLGFQQARQGVRSAGAKLGEVRGSAGERVSQVSGDARNQARKQFESVQAKVDEAGKDARERAGSLTGEVRTRVESIGDEVRDRADSAGQKAKERLEQIQTLPTQVQSLPSTASRTASRAVDVGRTRVERLVKRGSDSATPAAPKTASKAASKTAPKTASKASPQAAAKVSAN